jgi:hypothetical protein
MTGACRDDNRRFPGALPVLLALALALLPAACDTQELLDLPLVRQASVRPNPNMAVAALVDLEVGRDTRHVILDFGPTTAYGKSTPALVVHEGANTLAIPGLVAGEVNHLRIRAVAPNGFVETGADLPVTLPSLPANFPKFEVQADSGLRDGYYLLVATAEGDTPSDVFQGAPVLIDGAGQVVWYVWMDVPRANFTRAGDFARQANGNFTVYLPAESSFAEYDLAGNKVRTWSDPAASWGGDGHDFQILPNGNALFIGHEGVRMDLSAYPLGGDTDASVDVSTIDEIDPRGGVVSHISLFPQITPEESLVYVEDERGGLEFQHANAFDWVSDGGLVVSLLLTGNIVKLDRATEKILWRLGGWNSDFTFVDDPLGGNIGQHSVQVLPDGNLLMFDNGLDSERLGSRVVEYRLDDAARTATMVWDYHHDPEIHSVGGGAAQRLPNGDTLVGWSNVGLVERVRPDRSVAWAMKTSMFYRVRFVPDLFPQP